MFYLNAMLTPVKKNHLEEKHRWGSGIDYWWEGEKRRDGKELENRPYIPLWTKGVSELLTFSQQHWFGHRTIKPWSKKTVTWGSQVKANCERRKKLDLQRLIYCQANTTQTGIYQQGHSQVGTAFTIEKREAGLQSKPSAHSVLIPSSHSSKFNSKDESHPLLLGPSLTTLLHSHLGPFFKMASSNKQN